jgi:hypothetical protein
VKTRASKQHAANLIADFDKKAILPAAQAETRGGNEILRRKS